MDLLTDKSTDVVEDASLWHDRVSVRFTSSLDSQDNDPFLVDIHDNSSYQCSAYDGLSVGCVDTRPLWWRVLQWLKMMLMKIAVSYHGKPFLLALGPLLIGLLMGYCLASQQNHKQYKAKRQQTRIVRDFISLITLSLTRYFKTVESRENQVRRKLKNNNGTLTESGVDKSQVPRHLAVIMDGNRRYGKMKYGNASQGHWDGSSKLVEFAKWCIAENISFLTVYAFSTENWNRDPAEVSALMAIFSKYCDELREEALQRNIKVLVLSTESQKIPTHVKQGLEEMVSETQHCTGMTMNICMSYGSRGEIVAASRSLATDVAKGVLDINRIDEDLFESRLLTCASGGNPDVLIRTSGEIRISNFLLWQLAYTEMFFVNKAWPAIEKEDLLRVIRSYADGRIRRYGK